MEEKLNTIIKHLPQEPGVYQFINDKGDIIYIGKAKKLKNRVKSYFAKNHETNKTRVLVKHIRDIHTIIVSSETEALLLENNLIKKHQPRYNILLKDDKTFPWICIKKEPFPRVISTRTKNKNDGEYFGPYTSVKMLNVLLSLIKDIFHPRTCSYLLSDQNIQSHKYDVCLEYHIGNCLAPCVGKQTTEEYEKTIQGVRNVLKGNFQEIKTELKGIQEKHVANLAFEKAQVIKEKLAILADYQSKSIIVSPTIQNTDVFGIVDEEKNAYVNYFKIMNGAIVQGHTIEIKKKFKESIDEILSFAIIDLQKRFDSDAKEIIVPFKTTLPDIYITQIIPKIGDKKKLLELATKNATYFRLGLMKQRANISPTKHQDRILQQLQKDLRMQEIPKHIECFDNSNIQGAFPVAACVVFKNGKPAKKDYRHFNIKTVVGPDDFASMTEVVHRRYTRLLEEKKPLPQLIIIDGGKGQLSAALKSLEDLGLRGKITIIGIAKRLEEIYFPGDPIPLYIDKKSESLKIIQQLRNEAHRFGITFHRNKRSQHAFDSELTNIPGIGKVSCEKLLKKFKSVKRIKEATLEELTTVLNKKSAKIVNDYFSA